jgi:hypothetical protein
MTAAMVADELGLSDATSRSLMEDFGRRLRLREWEGATR